MFRPFVPLSAEGERRKGGSGKWKRRFICTCGLVIDLCEGEKFSKSPTAAVQEDLQAPIMKLKSSVEVFKPSSANKVAEKVKQLLDKSTVATVHGVVHTLLRHKDIERIAEGEKGRQSLKAIMEAYPAVIEESLPAELVKQAKKVLKVDEPDVSGEGHEGKGTDASGTGEGVEGTPTKAKRLRVGAA